jgi:muconolactone delta-isomerase
MRAIFAEVRPVRFLVITKSIHPLPFEQAPALADAMQQWADANRASGKIEQIWGLAGVPGGGGILSVNSHEELDEIMTAFPFGNWSDTQIYAIADLDHTLATFRKALQQAAPS